jgi:hypothetical protein
LPELSRPHGAVARDPQLESMVACMETPRSVLTAHSWVGSGMTRPGHCPARHVRIGVKLCMHEHTPRPPGLVMWHVGGLWAEHAWHSVVPKLEPVVKSLTRTQVAGASP